MILDTNLKIENQNTSYITNTIFSIDEQIRIWH